VILIEFRLETHYGPLLYALLLHTVAPYGSLPKFQVLKTLKVCGTKLEKIILKTKMSFPKSALLSEFGWKPINEFLDRQRVIYFARFDELPAHRLCKIVFMELKNSECVEWK
jgi:hypothetical protein